MTKKYVSLVFFLISIGMMIFYGRKGEEILTIWWGVSVIGNLLLALVYRLEEIIKEANNE